MRRASRCCASSICASTCDDRIALLGANGNGKSTMIKLLAGRLQPLSGTMRRSPKLKIGYFAQHQQDELDLAATPLQLMERAEAAAAMSRSAAPIWPASASASARPTPRVGQALGRREGAPALRADDPRGAAYPAARRADQPSRRRCARGAGPGAERIRGRRRAGEPRSASDRADRRPAVAGRRRPLHGLTTAISRITAACCWSSAASEAREKDPTAPRARAAPRTAIARRSAARRPRPGPQTAHLRKAAQTAERRLRELEGRRKLIETKLADPAVYGGPTSELMRPAARI